MYLLRDVDKLLRNAKIPATGFGRDAMGDPRFVFDLRSGREPGQRTVDRITRFLEGGS